MIAALGLVELVGADRARAQVLEQPQHLDEHARRVVVRDLRLHLEGAGVGEGLEAGGDEVGQAELVDDAAVEARREAVVEHAREQHQRQVVGVGLGDRPHERLDRRLAAGALHEGEARKPLSVGRRAHARGLSPCEAAERARDGGAHAPGLDVAGGADDQVARAVEAREVAAHVAQVEPLDVFGRPGDAEAQRMVRPRGGARDVVDVDVVAGLVVVLEDLLADDALLDLEIGEARRAEDFAQQLDRAEHLLGRDRHLVEGGVEAGLGVQRAADALDRDGEGGGVGVALGAAEDHVLDEVGEAAGAPGLVAGADAREHGDDGAVKPRHRHRGHASAVWQGRTVGVNHRERARRAIPNPSRASRWWRRSIRCGSCCPARG